MPVDPNALGLDPATLQSILGLGGLNDKTGLLQQQMARAAALRRGSEDTSTTGIGAGLHGISNLIDNISGGLREKDLAGQQQALQQQQSDARGKYAALSTQAMPQIAANASPEERQTMMASILGRQRQLDRVAMLSGDPVLGHAGQVGLEDTRHQEATQGGLEERRLTRALEAQRAASEDAYRRDNLTRESKRDEQQAVRDAQTAKYQSGELGLRQAALAQDAFAPVQTGDGVYLLNRKTGQALPLTNAAGGGVASKGAGKADAGLDKQFIALQDAISTTKGRGNLNAENQRRLWASERLKALVTSPDGKVLDLNPQMVEEATGALGAMVANGHPAQAQLEALTPKSLRGDAAKTMQWLTNEPQGAGQQAFLHQMLKSAEREEQVIGGQLKESQRKSLPAYAHLREKDKARYDAILAAQGLTADEPPAAPASAHPQASEAEKWARANPADPRAAKILQQLGIKP